jgi:signal transduction histidine kinase
LHSAIGIISASLVFLSVALIFYYLSKKNFFASKKDSDHQIDLSNLNEEAKLKLNTLKKENDALRKEIKFLEDKNKRLKIKIEQMRQVINQLREQKNQLEESEKKLRELRVQKDDTLAMVAHDLKNPESTIKSFVELLESYDLSAQEQQDVFRGLMETSSRLVRLAQEFSQVISEEYIPFNMTKQESNLNELIEGIVKVNRVKANEKNIELRLYQQESPITLNVDPEKIKEVIDNFVGNAIKFCPEKSKVEVHTKIVNKEVIVEISDDGYGLTEDEVSYAFEKGMKLSTKPTAGESSSGLGLWITKRIVEEHEGRVYVKSKKGLGSTFAFTLPIK